MTGTETAPTGGQARRRARTRSALLGAALELLVEGRQHASIEEITKRAGVGFGSFYNHFDTKDQLFSEAVLQVLDTYAGWIAEATADLDDPAEVFGRGFRLTGRMALAAPDLFAPLLAHGTEVLVMDRRLRETALEDLRRGVESGRFVAVAPEALVMAAGGALLGLLRLISTNPAAVGLHTVDQFAEGVLRLLGVDADEAAEIILRPLPDNPPLTPAGPF